LPEFPVLPGRFGGFPNPVPGWERLRQLRNLPGRMGSSSHSFATTLNQNNQQYDSDNGGYNPDNRYIVHVSSPFLIPEFLKKLLERFRHDDGGGAKRHQKDGRKDEENERED